MKIKAENLMALLALMAAVLVIPSTAAATGFWQDDVRSSRRDSSGSWGRGGSSGMSHYPTTAEISQALYGTPSEPYDTSVDEKVPEVVQAG